MDQLTKELERWLVTMGLNPEEMSHKEEHAIKDLLSLLPEDIAVALEEYFGLFGAERIGLKEISKRFHLEEEKMMALIDSSLRRLAVTPEWQLLKEELKEEKK